MTDSQMIKEMAKMQEALDEAILEKGKALRLTEEEIEHKTRFF